MNSSSPRSIVLTLLVLLGFALTGASGVLTGAPAGAQQVVDFTQNLDFDEPEAWAMKYFASISLLTGLGPVREHERGSIDVGLELMSAPHLDREQRTVGFGGFKEEDLNRTPAWARIRATFGLPGKLALTAAATPPLEVDGVKAALFSLALSRPLWESDHWSLGARLHAQVGDAQGDLTCSAEDASIPPGAPGNEFGCRASSKDEVTLEYFGLEVSAAYRFGDDGPSVHFGVGRQEMDLEFQVDALTFDFHDRTLQLTDGSTTSFVAGATFDLTGKVRLGVEAFYSPLDVVRRGKPQENDGLLNVRALLSYRIR